MRFSQTCASVSSSGLHQSPRNLGSLRENHHEIVRLRPPAPTPALPFHTQISVHHRHQLASPSSSYDRFAGGWSLHVPGVPRLRGCMPNRRPSRPRHIWKLRERRYAHPRTAAHAARASAVSCRARTEMRPVSGPLRRNHEIEYSALPTPPAALSVQYHMRIRVLGPSVRSSRAHADGSISGLRRTAAREVMAQCQCPAERTLLRHTPAHTRGVSPSPTQRTRQGSKSAKYETVGTWTRKVRVLSRSSSRGAHFVIARTYSIRSPPA